MPDAPGHWEEQEANQRSRVSDHEFIEVYAPLGSRVAIWVPDHVHTPETPTEERYEAYVMPKDGDYPAESLGWCPTEALPHESTDQVVDKAKLVQQFIQDRAEHNYRTQADICDLVLWQEFVAPAQARSNSMAVRVRLFWNSWATSERPLVWV